MLSRYVGFLTKFTLKEVYIVDFYNLLFKMKYAIIKTK